MLGIIANALAIAAGGLLGGVYGRLVSDTIKKDLTLVFGVCALAMGIHSITGMAYMPAVVFSVVLGTLIGLVFHLHSTIQTLGEQMYSLIERFSPTSFSSGASSQLVTVIVVFCAGGTGIYGSLEAGITGDISILLSKAILDFFTAFIFACSLGPVVALISIPQGMIFTLLFFSATVIMPLATPEMIRDLRACGGFLMLATGLGMLDLKQLPTAAMIPAMILVMPFTFIWSNWIVPFL